MSRCKCCLECRAEMQRMREDGMPERQPGLAGGMLRAIHNNRVQRTERYREMAQALQLCPCKPPDPTPEATLAKWQAGMKSVAERYRRGLDRMTGEQLL